MVSSPDSISKHYGERIIYDQIEEATTDKELQIFFIMCNVKPYEVENTMRQMIMTCTRHASDFANMYEDPRNVFKESQILSVIEKSFFEKQNGKSTFCRFKCGNISVSRKKFEIMYLKLYK
jgi:hypothetical protein